ncbi:MAG: YbhN family protein [Gammaproteobacteria bacterium]
MPAALRGAALLLAFALVGCVLLALALDPGELWAALSVIPTGALAAAMLAALGNYALRWARWRVYLRRLGHRLPWGFDALSYAAGFAFTTTPGKAGEAARAVYLKPLGVAYGDTVGACIAERLQDLAAVTAISLLAVSALHEHAPLLLAAFAALLLALAGLGLARRLAGRPMRAWQVAGSRLRRLVAGGERTIAVALRLLGGGLLPLGGALGMAGWLLEATGFWMLASAAGLDLSWALAAGIYALGLLAGALSFLPGGLIGTELAVAALLVHFGASYQTAAAVTLAGRACTLWFSVALGLGALGLVHLRSSAREPLGAAAIKRSGA